MHTATHACTNTFSNLKSWIILLEVRLNACGEPVMFYGDSLFTSQCIEIKCSIIFTKHQKHIIEELC